MYPARLRKYSLKILKIRRYQPSQLPAWQRSGRGLVWWWRPWFPPFWLHPSSVVPTGASIVPGGVGRVVRAYVVHILVVEDLVLLVEDAVNDGLLFGRLRRQHEGLHEPLHGLPVVGQFAKHLHHHTMLEGRGGIHLEENHVMKGFWRKMKSWRVVL